jgi:hypothetical protein
MTYKPGAEKAAADWMESQDTTHVTSAIPLQQAQAAQTNFENLQRVFTDALNAVRVSEPKRDTSQNQRLRYELNWDKLRAAATNYAPLAKSRGIRVLVPAYHPPANTSAQWQEFEPPPPAPQPKFEPHPNSRPGSAGPTA